MRVLVWTRRKAKMWQMHANFDYSLSFPRNEVGTILRLSPGPPAHPPTQMHSLKRCPPPISIGHMARNNSYARTASHMLYELNCTIFYDKQLITSRINSISKMASPEHVNAHVNTLVNSSVNKNRKSNAKPFSRQMGLPQFRFPPIFKPRGFSGVVHLSQMSTSLPDFYGDNQVFLVLGLDDILSHGR